MSEDSFEEFRKFIEETEKNQALYRAFEENQSRFLFEMLYGIFELTYRHFTTKSAYEHLILEGELDVEAFRKFVFSNCELREYGIRIFEDVDWAVVDYAGFNVPADRPKRDVKPIEYPDYSDEALELKALEYEKDCVIELNDEQRVYLRDIFKHDALLDEFYVDYNKSLHNLLRKLTYTYYPEIAEISGEGIREVDYILYTHMSWMRDSLFTFMNNTVTVSVKPSALRRKKKSKAKQ